VQKVLEEVGFACLGNTTYSLESISNDIICKNLIRLSESHNINVAKDCLQLPFIQIIPKMHKNPISFRPIISSKKCITKQLSKDIGKCLKLLLQNLTKYCNTIYKSTHIQPNWIISNNNPIVSTLDSMSNSRRLKSIATYDFEKLYTNLDHSDITSSMSNVINIGFGNNKRFIKITTYKAYWSTSRTDDHTVDQTQLLQMIDELVNSCYFTVGSSVFKQKIGIPMGTDCAPFLANLFLFSFEFAYTMKLIKSGNYQHANNLRHVYRYIDDITSVNDNNYLQDNYVNIYPPCLNLKKVNGTDDKADVLDVSVVINPGGNCSTTVYDKRDDFTFKIVNFPDLRSNINKNMAYNVYKEEIRRYLRICSSSALFLDKCLQLINNLKSKGYSKKDLYTNIRKVLRKDKKFDTYQVSVKLFLTKLFS
jgi:hypothetical protein